MSFQDELQAALMGEGPDTDAPPGALDASEATRYLAQLDHLNRKETEMRRAYDEAVERMRSHMAARLAETERTRAWLEEALVVWHEAQLALDPEGSKTITLPTGTLVSRMGQASWVVEDEEALKAWALEHCPTAVTFAPAPPPRLGKAELKRELKGLRTSDGRVMVGDGTTVPGLRVDPPERKFDYRLPGEAD
jgi:hypothetical protein